jgi:hypothetical protein
MASSATALPSGTWYSASTSTAGPHWTTAGARMKTARKVSDASALWKASETRRAAQRQGRRTWARPSGTAVQPKPSRSSQPGSRRSCGSP